MTHALYRHQVLYLNLLHKHIHLKLSSPNYTHLHQLYSHHRNHTKTSSHPHRFQYNMRRLPHCYLCIELVRNQKHIYYIFVAKCIGHNKLNKGCINFHHYFVNLKAGNDLEDICFFYKYRIIFPTSSQGSKLHQNMLNIGQIENLHIFHKFHGIFGIKFGHFQNIHYCIHN